MTPAMPTENMDETGADSGWDTYKERVLRNEGVLEGLRQLVNETRAADAKLIEQRSTALEKLVDATAKELSTLMREQRQADRTEFRSELASAKELSETIREEHMKRTEEKLKAAEKISDTAIAKNYEQSNGQIKSADDRSIARWNAMEQQVSQWRAADREARELQAAEYARRLDVLNHAQATLADFQNKSVTRELWQVGEQTMNEKIVNLEKQILGLVTAGEADRAHRALEGKIESAGTTQRDVSEARFKTVEEKIAELKEGRGEWRGSNRTNVTWIGWGIAAFATLISIIIAANAIFGK